MGRMAGPAAGIHAAAAALQAANTRPRAAPIAHRSGVSDHWAAQERLRAAGREGVYSVEACFKGVCPGPEGARAEGCFFSRRVWAGQLRPLFLLYITALAGRNQRAPRACLLFLVHVSQQRLVGALRICRARAVKPT